MNRPQVLEELSTGEWSSDTLFCRKDVMRFLGISSTQFWRLRRYHGFPSGIRLSPGLERWRLRDIIAWVNERQHEQVG